MKQITYILLGIILGVVGCLLLMNKCGNQPKKLDAAKRHLNIDSLNLIQAKIDNQALLAKLVVKNQDSITQKVVDRWREAKRDTVYYDRDKIVNLCDSMRTDDSTAIVVRDIEICDLEESVGNLKLLNAAKDIQHSNDSTALREAKKEIKRQKWKTRGVLFLWAVREGAGIVR